MGAPSGEKMSLSFSPSRLDRAPEGNQVVPANEACEPENQLRVQQLSNKLTSLQDELEQEKQARNDAVELKLKVLDDKLLRAQVSEEDKLRPLHEQITSLQQELAAERLSREVMDERKTKEIKAVESSISLDLTVEKRARKDLIHLLHNFGFEILACA